ncbi:sensor histidine kinase [Microbacterium sp. A93]|uniref:sensor histidine kinase n=1 Tax=Microbacterium sp. A93 TaxID=3450716 RepID=UPI003F41D869
MGSARLSPPPPPAGLPAGLSAGLSAGPLAGRPSRPLPNPAEDTRIPALLAAMRILLHVSVAGLLVIGLVRSLTPAVRAGDHGLIWQIGLLAAVFAAIYLAGTVVEKRRSEGHNRDRTEGHNRDRTEGAAAGRIVVRGQFLWLAAVTLTWLGLMAVHLDFAWLVFPLFFLHLHTVGARSVLLAVTLVVALTAVVLVGFWWHEGTLGIGAVVGPVIGAVVAVAMSAAYSLFYAEARTQRRIAAQLQATRDDLARSERHAGAMRERERWAQDLHDTLAQGLASVVLLSRAAQEQQPAEPLAGQLRQIERSAVENLAQARALVEQRSPGAGLTAELAAVCRSTQDTARSAGAALTVELRGPEVMPDAGPVAGSGSGQTRSGPGGSGLGGSGAGGSGAGSGNPVMAAEAATIVLRVAQSALANVLQHAGAGRCVVSFAVHRDEVTLDVFDDGSGRGGRPEGFGIATMRDRAARAGGTLTVEDAFEPASDPPGPRGAGGRTGTVVALSLPRWGPRATESATEQTTEAGSRDG